MSNRVIKDCISNHPLVAKLTAEAQDQFLRWILLADDWGCFNADADVVKGACYAKRPKITVKVIEALRSEFYETGFLFCWLQNGIIWGYWTWWETGEFAGIISYSDKGERNRNRRRTPEPPAELLAEYLSVHPYVMAHLDATGRSMTHVDATGAIPRSLFPSPPNPSDSVSLGAKKSYGEFGHVRLTDVEHAKLKAKLNGHTDELIAALDRWAEDAPEKFRKRKNHYATILTWYDRKRKAGEFAAGKPGEAVFTPEEFN